MAAETCEYPPLPNYVQDMGTHAGPAISIIDDSVKSIANGSPPPIGPVLSSNMTLPGVCAAESIRAGRTIKIPDPIEWW